MFESLFQLLFEYRPHLFQQGEFRFSPPAGGRRKAELSLLEEMGPVFEQELEKRFEHGELRDARLRLYP